MNERNAVINYLFKQYFKGDIETMEYITGYSQNTINNWLIGTTIPNNRTIEYVNHKIFTPEFTVVHEFYEIFPSKPMLTQLRNMYKGHEHRSGIYAFYDSMANLLYVGKAIKLLDETYSALRRDSEINFPAGIKNINVQRHQVTRYISAYDIKSFDSFDYPKHVESLILRISKPRMNKQIGILEEAFPKIED